MNTNARQHVERERKGQWRTATRGERCSRYFGRVGRCTMILAGERYFDTQEPIPGRRANYRVCAKCASAVTRAYLVKGAA